MYDKCRGQHYDCDICDGMRNDADTGWGGFTDHFAKKHFKTTEERDEYYKKKRDVGESGENDSYDSDD